MFNAATYNTTLYNGTTEASELTISPDIASGGEVENKKAICDGMTEEERRLILEQEAIAQAIEDEEAMQDIEYEKVGMDQ
jgi:hypothetical protein